AAIILQATIQSTVCNCDLAVEIAEQVSRFKDFRNQLIDVSCWKTREQGWNLEGNVLLHQI
ncbi:hypothetical protein, partial [Actinobacillus pleuropneumoniae]|uniref:hypothetical protein n=1 Tax=Actinobacillus pleuropneumoniae TaxID=715 RepID=UPI00227C5D49